VVITADAGTAAPAIKDAVERWPAVQKTLAQ